MGRRPKQTFFQRTHTDGRQTHEEMINITKYQRNANQSYNKVSPHTSQKGHHQTLYKNKCWRMCGENVYYLWECKLVQSLWRTVWRYLKKLKMELPYDPAISLLGEIIIRKDACTPMFIAALFTIAKTWKKPKYPSAEEWIKKM